MNIIDGKSYEKAIDKRKEKRESTCFILTT